MILSKDTIWFFLDLDGVLRRHDQDCPNTLTKECVIVFNNILNKYDCEIILSSAWKSIFPDLYECQQFFLKQGLIKVPQGYTPYAISNKDNVHIKNDTERRVLEIFEWNKIHNIRNRMKWLAIDDLCLFSSAKELAKEDFNMLPYFDENNFVLTQESICDLGVAEEILNKMDKLKC